MNLYTFATSFSTVIAKIHSYLLVAAVFSIILIPSKAKRYTKKCTHLQDFLYTRRILFSTLKCSHFLSNKHKWFANACLCLSNKLCIICAMFCFINMSYALKLGLNRFLSGELCLTEKVRDYVIFSCKLKCNQLRTGKKINKVWVAKKEWIFLELIWDKTHFERKIAKTYTQLSW